MAANIHSYSLSTVFLVAAAGLGACADAPPHDQDASQREQDISVSMGQQHLDSRGTALVLVGLNADHTLNIETVVLKPFEYTTAGVPFDPRTHTVGSRGHAVEHTPWLERQLPRVPGLPARLNDDLESGSPPLLHTHPIAVVSSGAGAIVVRHPNREVPFVAPLTLGAPGEGGGDVADSWDNGSRILRAPYYGRGTIYEILRLEPDQTLLFSRGVVR